MSRDELFAKCQADVLNHLLLGRSKSALPPAQRCDGSVTLDGMLQAAPTVLYVEYSDDLVAQTSTCGEQALMAGTPCQGLHRTREYFFLMEVRGARLHYVWV
jgi:hypothetical protein